MIEFDEEHPDFSKEIAKLAKEATGEAFLRAKNSERGATILLRDGRIVRIFADDSFEVIKDKID